MPRNRPSVALMIAMLVAVAAAVWAVSVRSRPSFAVYDSVPAPPPAPLPAPGESTGAANLPPSSPDTASAAPATPVSPHRTVPSSTVRAAETARADTPADTAAAPDSVRHHRSDNYGGYSGYGSKERRPSPNAR